jgi:hypothetical protein
MSTSQTEVDIWIGSEWAPIRAAFASYLSDLWPDAPSNVVIIATSLNHETPTGRVGGWVRRALSPSGNTLIEREPGQPFAPESASGQTVIGITELLLDPDPAQVDQFYALGIWSRFVPRRKRLLMRVTPFLVEEIVDNAVGARPALLLHVAEWCGQRVLIASTDLIAAEVVGRGLRSVAQPAGDIGETPWQSDLVRIASEQRLSATSGSQVTLGVHRAGPMPPLVASEFHALVEAVGQLVDCRVTFAG